jgi:two-component system response regulator FixJ
MEDKKVFVVDDEVKVLEVIGETLGGLSLEVTCFVRPSRCLERLCSEECDLLITDLRMPEMDGIELVANVRRLAPWVSVLVMTGYGDVATAVRAMKAGAADFMEKPLEKGNLLRTVKSLLRENVHFNTCVGEPLTGMQMKVLKSVIDGKSNKEIAALLGRSTRTIEVHRADMMEKLGVSSLLDLIKRAISLGLIDLMAKPRSDGTPQQAEPNGI